MWELWWIKLTEFAQRASLAWKLQLWQLPCDVTWRLDLTLRSLLIANHFRMRANHYKACLFLIYISRELLESSDKIVWLVSLVRLTSKLWRRKIVLRKPCPQFYWMRAILWLTNLDLLFRVARYLIWRSLCNLQAVFWLLCWRKNKRKLSSINSMIYINY